MNTHCRGTQDSVLEVCKLQGVEGFLYAIFTNGTTKQVGEEIKCQDLLGGAPPLMRASTVFRTPQYN